MLKSEIKKKKIGNLSFSLSLRFGLNNNLLYLLAQLWGVASVWGSNVIIFSYMNHLKLVIYLPPPKVQSEYFLIKGSLIETEIVAINNV